MDEAWFDPDLSPEEFKRLGYRAVDMIAEYYRTIRDVPVFPVRTPSDVIPAFDEPVPERGQDPDAILDAWTRDVLPNTTHMGSPRYFGYVMGSGTMMGVLAEALAASVNTNAGGWKPAPAATEMERRTLGWVSEIIGYAPGATGILLSGGTMANVAALVTALRNTAAWDTTATGLQDPRRTGRFRVYMADHEAHVSLYRACDILNLGREAVRLVPSTDDFRLDVAALRRALDEDRANGDVPFCVVGHVGSINVGAIDPLDEIADVCEEQGLWFHADGACGAVGAMLPELRALYHGMDRADSVSLDPHKWLYVPYECGLLLVREPEKLRRAFSMSASYLRGTLPTEYTGHDFFEFGPQMSRGFRALKLWMTLKHYGVEGYRKLLGQNVRCAHHAHAWVREHPDFQVLHEPVMYIYSFRYAPERLLGEAAGEGVEERLDWLNQRIADELQATGQAFVMTSRIHGRTVLRLSICSHRTTLEDIEAVLEKMAELGAALDEGTDAPGA